MKTKVLSTCFLLRLFFALPVMLARLEAAAIPTTRANIYDETADGSKQISDALNTAKRENKRVLLQFGANWGAEKDRQKTEVTADKDQKRPV